MLDGVAGPWFRGMRNAQDAMQFSPDGRRFAYYRINEGLEGQWVVDGVAQRWVNDVPPLGLAQLRGVGVLDPPMVALFSPDSRRFAYWADVKEKGVAIIEDDSAGPLFHAASRPLFSPDSRHLAYTAQTFEKHSLLVLDGAAGPEWPTKDTGDPVFSPDSQHTALTMRREEGGLLRKHRVCTVIVDGQLLAEHPGDDASALPVFSPDGNHVAWTLQRGTESFVFIDDQAGPPMQAVGELRFTPSGRSVHVANLGQSDSVVVDGRPGPLAQSLLYTGGDPANPEFRVSPLGDHVAWVGQFSDGVRPVIDDRIGPAFEQMPFCAFRDNESAEWLGQRGATIYRVTARA